MIVCERTGQWAVAWRQAWRRAAPPGGEPRELPLIETRSPAECLATLAACPAAFVLIELAAASCEQNLELLLQISLLDRQATAAVAAERPLAEYEWLVRELGAVHFLTSPRELSPLCRMASRYAVLLPDVKSRDEVDGDEHIWNRLPWGAA